MIRLELTQQEALITYGFMEEVLKKVKATSELELANKEATTASLESIMGKILNQLENQSTNN